ncbi:MAG: hypothetical protein R3E39_21765 [Anaerolineae bacterium]
MIGIRCAWDDPENTVIRLYIGDLWDWEDLSEATKKAAMMVASVEHQVDFIIVMRSSGSVPEGNAMLHMRDAIKKMPRNGGIMVMIGGNTIINATLKMLARNYQCMTGRIFQRDHLADAYRIIARNRPEIYEGEAVAA